MRKVRKECIILLIAGILLTGCSLQNGEIITAIEISVPETHVEEKVNQDTYVPDIEETAYQNTEESIEESNSARKALFRDIDGTIHGSQIGLTESGKPLYDYDIDTDTIPDEWLYGNFHYSAGTEGYMSEAGNVLYRDPDGTIHGPQIGLTENGSPLYDYDFDPAIIPEEWQYSGFIFFR